ncbi:MAG: NAD(P)-dependent oxidoreductase [Pseudomonadota bacterium]
MAELQKIGFVGVGNMGAPMALNLARAGYAVIAFDNREDVRDAAANQHERITAAETLANVAVQSQIIIVMLPDSRVVNAVVLGDGEARQRGLADDLKAGAVIVDMSSSFAPATQKLADALKHKSIAMVDAPVSGGVPKAVSGELAIMAGGTDADLDRVEPILMAMGHVFRTGAVGSGHAMKALNNYVSAAGLIATSEALSVGAAFGLDPERMVNILNASTGRNNTTENKASRYMLSEAFDSGFALALMAKDVGMARDLAADMGQKPDELAFVSEFLNMALSSLGKDADHTEIYRYVLANRTRNRT